jgi:hypothetical protein
MGTDPGNPTEGVPSFTRTLWYAIRETRKKGWVERSGALPATETWRQWLREAEDAARLGNRHWEAVRRMRALAIMEHTDISRDEVEPAFVQA